MEWENRAWKGIRLNKTIKDNHYEICWNYHLECLIIDAENIPQGKRLFLRTFRKSDLEQFPELLKNECFIEHWYRQLACRI